jgi:hypothetical protein
MAGVVSLPHYSPPSHLDNSRSFPRRRPFVFASIALAIAGIVVLTGGLVMYLAARDFNPLGGLDALWQGGQEASQTAGFATSEGLQYGQLTQSELHSRFPSTKWLSASTVSTYSQGERTDVSFLATGDHIITAVAERAGLCSWGLAVQSSSDPIITSDGLRGQGVYYTFTGPKMPTNPQCEANGAPVSGWNPLGGLNTSG